MLLHHPEIQGKIHAELDETVGLGRPVSLEHQDLLPYTYAVILETLRMFPPAPFAVPHCATEDANLGIFRIPKGILHTFKAYRRNLQNLHKIKKNKE